MRPLRPPRTTHRASIVTANVTAASTLLEELRYGSSLANDNYLLVQELACGPDACEAFSRDVLQMGHSLTVQ